MWLLDTSTLIDLEEEMASSRVGPVRKLLGSMRAGPVACSTISVGELVVGSDEEAVRFFLRRMRKIPLTEAIAYRAGELDAELMSRGQRLGENDTWIAATALYYSATLIFADGDFLRVPGLKTARVGRMRGVPKSRPR